MSRFAKASNRIEEEAEAFDDESSSDYEEIGPSSVARVSSNLFEAELGTKPDQQADAQEDDEEEEEVRQLDEDLLGAQADRKDAIKERISKSQDQMKYLLEMFDEEQIKRYRTFRRAKFPLPAIKKLLMKVLDQQVNQSFAIAMAGIAKVYVGELVEESRRVMEEVGEGVGPVQPSHLLEAQRRLRAAGLAPGSATHRKPKNRLL